ncbi:3',5'-cyclic-nucleotide phosphodiesterase [Golovinomyces cichoracearum]|uniref:3',5'-cyclic-nucleotide phosphodiesterase n=1 Tax=Golovinomyces cichoracearum TaxID=62708 RepID=A0A420JA53_9PEZI|nr:3',5'-cyclic-nucleotide phosphodiesterase [Golovinomyces cichoracearum]
MASQEERAALQVIVLGSGGGPIETNTTAFLVRSVAKQWSKGSLLAVDAGVHLASISEILEKNNGSFDDKNSENELENSRNQKQPKRVLSNGPFAGMELQHKSIKANAGYITGVLVGTYLITHPHLDHISGLVVNSSSLPKNQPKIIAGLPSTISALKTHIFNNIIWPNLSDENNGAGLVSYMRLVEDKSPSLFNSEDDGFVEVCEGLQVKTWSVSHGHCVEKHEKLSSTPESQSSENPRIRAGSTSSFTTSERNLRKSSFHDRLCFSESSAFLIQDVVTRTEILIFGDVEPDSISLFPRNKNVWTAAAPRIVAGNLRGIFIECSYDDTRSVDGLFGHLAPRYLIEELKVLADEVDRLRTRDRRKRKRASDCFAKYMRRKTKTESAQLSPYSSDFAEKDYYETDSKDDEFNDSDESCQSLYIPESAPTDKSNDEPQVTPLKGIKLIIIHIKEKLDDSPNVADIIYQQLLEYERQAQLGCEIIISSVGQSLYF